MSSSRSLVPVDYRDIERDTLDNTSYRKVVYTVPGRLQIVLMSLAPGETIPWETHADTVQFVRVERGRGVCQVGKQRFALHDGVTVTIPNGHRHCFANTSKRQYLRLYSIYTPPEHPPHRHQRRQPHT